MEEGTDEFEEILANMLDTHQRKDHDYAGEVPYSNLRECEKMGIPAWQGVVIRMGDKWSRIQNFVKQGELRVKDETILDTLMDMAVYSVIAMILYKEARNETNKA